MNSVRSDANSAEPYVWESFLHQEIAQVWRNAAECLGQLHCSTDALRNANQRKLLS